MAGYTLTISKKPFALQEIGVHSVQFKLNR